MHHGEAAERCSTENVPEQGKGTCDEEPNPISHDKRTSELRLASILHLIFS